MRQGVARRLFSAAVILVALLMIVLILIPVHFWHHPKIDAVYRGFDPNLVYATERGNGTSNGIIDISHNSIDLTALPGSQPAVDLVTTPLSFSASMDVRVLQTSTTGTPLSVGIWSPSTVSGYFLKFNVAPTDTITAESIVGGLPSKTLDGKLRQQQTVGIYLPGWTYHVAMSLDKSAKGLFTSISTRDALPFPGRVLRAGDPNGDYEDFRANPVTVVAGHTYNLGGWVDYVGGDQPYAIGILWSDKKGNFLPFDNWWHSPSGLNGWTVQQASVVAPSKASRATLFLASGAGSSYLFGHVSLRDASKPGANLLSNGDFLQGSAGWRIINKPGKPIQTVDSKPIAMSSYVTAAEFPELFRAFRPSLSVSASSQSGIGKAEIQNYTLTLPSQPDSAAELVEKIDDGRAKLATLLLAGLGVGLGVLGLILRGRRALLRSADRRADAKPWWGKRAIASRLWLVLTVSGATLLYLVGNATLFHFGTPHFDVFTPKIWSYLAAQGGFLDLYFRPFVIPAAGVQGGVPWHDAVFPYGPTKVYYYLAIGTAYKWIFSPPGALVMDTFQLEFLLKFMNILFGLADALLIYLILVKVGVSSGKARIATALFLFNPAVWFIMSIWGSTESVSIFFMLLSIWLAEIDHPTAAWMSLAAGAFTRPQMLVIAFLLACVYLRRFSIGRSLMAIAWSVVAFFVLLVPLSLAISPSMPIDYVSHILNFSVGTGQADAAYSGISPGYYSVWTIPLQLLNHQDGMNRMWYPRVTPLFGSISYAQAGTFISVAIVLAAGLLILLRRNAARSGWYLLVVALGMFGWLMVTTNLVSRYFFYGLVLVILCRRSLKDIVYFSSVAALTVIVLVTSWSHFAIDIIGNLAVGQPLYPKNNAVTRFFLSLFTDDRFITAGSLTNIIILGVLAVMVVRGLIRSRPPLSVSTDLFPSNQVVMAGGSSQRSSL
jgi:Gpi18-like mannosyltransferase